MFDHTPTVGDIGRDIAVHHDGLATDRHIVEEVALDDVLQRQKHPCGVQGTTVGLVKLTLDLPHATINVAVLVAGDRKTHHDNLLIIKSR